MTLPCPALAVALDVADLETASRLAQAVSPIAGTMKVGLELYTRFGPEAVAVARAHGAQVFLDLKLHDIPETVERAVDGAGGSGATLLTVHASGGRAMLEAAVRGASKWPGMKVLAVTVLTSLDADDLRSIGVQGSPAEQARSLAALAWSAGVRGFVTSAHEAPLLREALGPEAFLVTPGIRPAGGDRGDQKRVATPASAIAAGADLLVVGRPIHGAPDPAEAASRLAAEIEGARHEPRGTFS
jgi:orotidine-5'-phosphate decarboxylase